MANKGVEVILGAVKSAGEAALRLHEQNERLRGLLREALDIPYMNGEDLLHLSIRIHDALDGAADQPAAGRAYYETHEPPHCPTCECGADNSPGITE